MTLLLASREARPKRPIALSASIIVLYVAAIGSFLMLGGDRILQWAFPTLSLIIATILYIRFPADYLSFGWWLWFLTPEVRRIVDYHIGWNSIDPTMLAPYLAALPTMVTVARALLALRGRMLLGFLMVAGGIAYAFAVGLQTVGASAAIYALLNWLLPVAYCFYLVTHHRRLPEFREAIKRTFVSGALAMGLYGIYQYFYLPAWDADWIVNSEMYSQGMPEPQLVRVFSTMNSSGPFAFVMMTGVLLIATQRHRLRLWAAPPAVASLLLSLVRASWLGLGVSAAYLLLQVRGNLKLRHAATFAVLLAISLPVLSFGPIADTLGRRFETVANLSQDDSFQSRASFYSEFLGRALTNVIGSGLGATGLATKMDNGGHLADDLGVFDSGILELPFVFGWPGTLLYVGGLTALLLSAFSFPADRRTNWTLTCRAIVLAALSFMLFVGVLSGVTGMVTWCFLGLLLAERAARDEARPTAAGRGN